MLYLYGNYGGDVMNFDLAAELADAEGIEVATVLGADDVASAPRGEEARRRGIAGMFFLYKVAGASADPWRLAGGGEAGHRESRRRHAQHGRCARPVHGAARLAYRPSSWPAGEMEIGMGIHGEPGVRRGPLESADAIGEQLTRAVLQDLPYERGDEVGVLVNGLGATPREELYILYRQVNRLLDAAGVRPYRVWIGEYVTSLEMAGASLSLLRLDDELKALVDAPAQSPFFVQR